MTGGLCILNAVIIRFIKGEHSYAALCVIAGSLMFACVTDCMTCEVYNFTWWIAGASGIFRLFSGGEEIMLLPLILYILLQQIFFTRLYGRGDCHAFCVCAMTECTMGISFKGYLLHMLLAIGFLAAVQALRHNIERDGNLKKPVAFLPYITVSFWILLFCNNLT